MSQPTRHTMDDEELSYKTLRKTQNTEKNQPTLTKLPQHFYNNVAIYITKLENNYQKETNEQKQKLFHDEIELSKKIALSIYELREKKIVQAALSTIRGGKPDLQNIQPPEKKLYDNLVTTIHTCRNEIIQTKQKQPKNENKQTNNTPQEKIKQPKETQKPPISEHPTNTNPIIHIQEHIPEFVGTDMNTYLLRKDDILSIPPEISKTLIKRGVAKEIKKAP